MRLSILLGLVVLTGCTRTVVPPPPPPPPTFSVATGNPGILPCENNPPPCLQSYTVNGDGTAATLAITTATYSPTGFPTETKTYTFVVNMLGASGKVIQSPPTTVQ